MEVLLVPLLLQRGCWSPRRCSQALRWLQLHLRRPLRLLRALAVRRVVLLPRAAGAFSKWMEVLRQVELRHRDSKQEVEAAPPGMLPESCYTPRATPSVAPLGAAKPAKGRTSD